MKITKDKWDKIQKYKLDGYLRVQYHPTIPELSIWNYTNKAAYDDLWDDVTIMCRGLVINTETLEIVSQCLPKFFNWEQLNSVGKLPKGDYVMVKKMDGSYINVFYYKGEWITTSRGSFDSDQAKWGQEMVGENLPVDPKHLLRGCTYVFELIHPNNRIVCNYGDLETLCLLAIIMPTGKEVNLYGEDRKFIAERFNVAEKEGFGTFNGDISHLEMIQSKIPDNEEGYILIFDDGKRVKIKGAEYCRLHRIVTHISSRDIWKMLRDGDDLRELIENVPDEFIGFVNKTVGKQYIGFRVIKSQVMMDMHYGDGEYLLILSDGIQPHTSRKHMAEYIKSCQYPKLMFTLIDRGEKALDNSIWCMLEPDYEKGFSV